MIKFITDFNNAKATFNNAKATNETLLTTKLGELKTLEEELKGLESGGIDNYTDIQAKKTAIATKKEEIAECEEKKALYDKGFKFTYASATLKTEVETLIDGFKIGTSASNIASARASEKVNLQAIDYSVGELIELDRKSVV